METKLKPQNFSADRELYIAPSNYGKSMLISEHVIAEIKIKKFHPSRILIFSPTHRTDDSELKLILFCLDIYPEFMNNCYEEINEDIIRSIYDTQKEIKETGAIKNLHHYLMIFDDVISSTAISTKRSIMQQLATTGRHYNISSILSLQSYTSSMNTIIRKQMSCVCIGRLLSTQEIELVLEQYDQGFAETRREAKKRIYDVWVDAIQENENHGFLVIFPYVQFGEGRIQIGDFNGSFFDRKS